MWADTFTGLYHLPPDGFAVPATVLDLGANIGLVAAHYQALWPDAQVVAYEMDHDSAVLARMNAPGVQVVEAAVGTWTGEGHYDPSVLSEAFALSARRGDEGWPRVQVKTLPAIVSYHFGITGVDLVKMDIEGGEWDLLKAAIQFEVLSFRDCVGAVICELHGDGGSVELVREACRLFDAVGYQAAWTGRHPQAVWAVRR